MTELIQVRSGLGMKNAAWCRRVNPVVLDRQALLIRGDRIRYFILGSDGPMGLDCEIT